MQRFFEKTKIITVWWDPLSVFPILCSIFTNPYSVLVLCSMPTPGKQWQEFRFLGLLHLMNHSKSTEKFHQFHYWFYEFYRAYPLDIQNQDTGFLISWLGHKTHYDIKQDKVTSKKGNLGCLLTISDPSIPEAHLLFIFCAYNSTYDLSCKHLWADISEASYFL